MGKECLIADTVTSILNIIQKLTTLLAFLLQNLMQVLERSFRKDEGVLWPTSCSICSWCIWYNQQLAGFYWFWIQIAKTSFYILSTNERGSKCGLVKVAAVKKVSIQIQMKRSEAFSLFTSHRLKMSVLPAHCDAWSSRLSMWQLDIEPGNKA